VDQQLPGDRIVDALQDELIAGARQRGDPGWASTSLDLSAARSARDLAAGAVYTGCRARAEHE
jgi:hypothetical protein